MHCGTAGRSAVDDQPRTGELALDIEADTADDEKGGEVEWSWSWSWSWEGVDRYGCLRQLHLRNPPTALASTK